MLETCGISSLALYGGSGDGYGSLPTDSGAVAAHTTLSQRNFVVHQRDPLHLNIPYPSRMLKQKQQEKDEVQIHKFWQMFMQLHINITLADALILILKYQKMLKALLSNKEKLLELANTPLNENCSAVILKKLPEKLGDPKKFLIPCGFKMILCEGDERLTLNMRHDTSSYLNQPPKESINMINVFSDSSEDFIGDLFTTTHQSGNPTFSSHPKLTSPKVKKDVFDLDQVLKPLFPSYILVEDSDSFLEKFDTFLSYSDISLPEFKTFIIHSEETNNCSTTTHADYSLPKYDSFLFEIDPDQGKLTSIVMKDNLAEARVHVSNVLTTHPTLILDSDFIPFDNSLPEFKTFYFDIKEKISGSTT
nr:reverse transcriptase domain-containing protein [Tanacetum cinerariifolium]